MDLKFSAHTYFMMRNSNLNSVSTENQHEILNKFGKCLLCKLCAHGIFDLLEMCDFSRRYGFLFLLNQLIPSKVDEKVSFKNFIILKIVAVKDRAC